MVLLASGGALEDSGARKMLASMIPESIEESLEFPYCWLSLVAPVALPATLVFLEGSKGVFRERWFACDAGVGGDVA